MKNKEKKKFKKHNKNRPLGVLLFFKKNYQINVFVSMFVSNNAFAPIANYKENTKNNE